MEVREMVSAIGAEATQSIEFGVGPSKDLKSREWVGCEHSMYEGVEKDGTRTLMHGSVGTHCTARTRVCGVKCGGE
jgi:hypothetical protein